MIITLCNASRDRINGEASMRRWGWCGAQVIGLVGFFLAFCGVLYATTTHTEPARSNWWRVVALGLVISGLIIIALSRPPLVVGLTPEVARRVGYGLGIVFVAIGVLIFFLSWV